MITINKKLLTDSSEENTVMWKHENIKGHSIIIISTVPEENIHRTEEKTIFQDTSFKTMRKGHHSFVFLNPRPPIDVDFNYQILINKQITNKKRHFFAFDKKNNPTITVGIYSE